jgi:hypothetical protein
MPCGSEVLELAATAQGMRAEPVMGRAALQFHQVAQPIADGAAMQGPAGLVGEQYWGSVVIRGVQYSPVSWHGRDER